jgi:hypothetical protein
LLTADLYRFAAHVKASSLQGKPMTQSVIARRTIGGVSHEIDTDKARLDIGLIHIS